MKENLLKRIYEYISLKVNTLRGVPHITKYSANGDAVVSHISAFSYANAGDTYLPVVLRDLFNDCIGVRKWQSIDVHKQVTSEIIDNLNKSDYIVIGGGGLFLADTCPNNTSGWQWNCSVAALNAIEKPIVAFAIGYNRFRGQEDFKPVFTEHLNSFVEKAVFVGIRNHGSIECLKPYLREELRNKLFFQPCMTTLTSIIYPDLIDYSHKEDFIAINCAFDRKGLRSPNDQYLKSIARVAKKMSNLTRIKIYSHLKSDLEILPYLDKENVTYELVELVHVRDILKAYSKPRLVVGMRGHAQMIPFGCLTPIVSIVSHNKMQWFLDDIGHPDWGADVDDKEFEVKLQNEVERAYCNYRDRISSIKIAQQKLWEITENNLKHINNLIKSN